MKTKFIGKVKLTKQGQVTLPLEARKELGIDLDSDVYWYLVDDCLVVFNELLSEKEVEKRVKKR